jgi:hypothetical protein
MIIIFKPSKVSRAHGFLPIPLFWRAAAKSPRPNGGNNTGYDGHGFLFFSKIAMV